MPRSAAALLACVLASGCTVTSARRDPTYDLAQARIALGIEVLLDDHLSLLRDKRLALFTNHAAVNRNGTPSVDLLTRDPRLAEAGAQVTMIFAPEHGLRVDQDQQFVADTIDARTGLPVISLYGRTTIAPPDSLLRAVHALIFDLPDIGTRTWTYVGALVYTMRAAARVGRPIIVTDRPNPITGFFVEGPLLDSALANADEDRPGRPARPYALHPIPLRHGMTIGELAQFYNEELRIGADLHVIPMRAWNRDLWYDRTGMPWVRPSPNMPSLHSALLYPGLVPFEGSNVSVGRGTGIPFQWFGAPWLQTRAVLDLLQERPLRGVRFVADTQFIGNATDGKYRQQRVPGIRIEVTERNRVQPVRIGATVLWALARTSRAELRVDTLAFDLRLGSPELRRALLEGADPDALMDREFQPVFAFRERVRRHFLY